MLKIFKNKKLIKTLQDHIIKLENELKEKNRIIQQKEKARRKIAGKVGGLTAENNRLIDLIADLNQKLIETKREFNEFKEGKYIVKELKPDKAPRRRQVMSVRSGEKTSKIIAKVKPTEEVEKIDW